jgi:hypothetical protein
MCLALVFKALAFCVFASFTQELLAAKGSLGELRHFHSVFQHFTAHPARAALIPLFALLSLICAAIAFFRAEKVGWTQFFGTRLGASMLLLFGGLCQLPMYFSRGGLDAGDPICHVNAIVEAGANYRLGQWPFYTFHFANGATLGLQYPMLRSLLGGLFAAVSPLNPDLNFQILCAAAHLLLLAGIYRLLRAWRFSRLACVIPALTLAGCHEMLLYYISAAFPALMSSAFAVWSLQALVRWFSSLRLRNALAAAWWFGFAVLGHPVTGLFTAYFLAPPILYFIVTSPPAHRKRTLLQACGFALLSLLIALPYLVSVVAFRHFNTYRPADVAAFQDQGVRIADNFKWIIKYMGGQSGASERGEYISVVLAVLIAAGLLVALSDRLAGRRRRPDPRYFAFFVLLLFCGGALLFYGRDTAWISAIPGVRLLKVNNRSFIFFALGIAMLAAKPIDRLLRANHPYWVLCLGVLLFLEQCPYWLRPTYFSLPADQKIHADEFKVYDHETASFLVIVPPDAGGCGDREDVAFRRAGFSGISPIDHEEQPIAGLESQDFHLRLAGLKSVAQAQPIIDRLKWLRVTDVIWRSDAIPPINLGQLGTVRTITNGVALHLNGPTMQRNLRDATLSIVPADLREASKTVLPIGFSPFLHCWAANDPRQEIPLTDGDGYAVIGRQLPVGATLYFRAITPLWQSAVTWASMVTAVIAGLLLLVPSLRKASPAPLPAIGG